MNIQLKEVTVKEIMANNIPELGGGRGSGRVGKGNIQLEEL